MQQYGYKQECYKLNSYFSRLQIFLNNILQFFFRLRMIGLLRKTHRQNPNGTSFCISSNLTFHYTQNLIQPPDINNDPITSDQLFPPGVDQTFFNRMKSYKIFKSFRILEAFISSSPALLYLYIRHLLTLSRDMASLSIFN